MATVCECAINTILWSYRNIWGPSPSIPIYPLMPSRCIIMRTLHRSAKIRVIPGLTIHANAHLQPRFIFVTTTMVGGAIFARIVESPVRE
ncbi:uncharacterized protein LOC112682320 isoform X2 [Sipha flava]|uniref:Uncharacterized protein LOC112682320 isoform X2 n=1 Tax=Sipha flava TaxID=143950 RepID=A0A8B8FD04_9HEMI|nr:uncharacterized protein LOC112682320 isoform X2 [Sipha flava]